MIKFTQSALAFALTTLLSSVVAAKGTPEEVAKLGVSGTPLTPTGAERAGNADGTIPAWDGGITQVPAGFKEGMQQPDPFPGDKPLFEITAKNYKDYGDKISAGQIAMFQKYPNWKMVVYQTRRSA
ncbi:MAG: DUF1329 domain-containing protein, partial [Dokdonella sp.]